MKKYKKHIFILILLTILGGVGFLFFPQLRSLMGYSKSDEALRQRKISLQKTEETIAAVEKLIEIPDEEPTVATINDLSKLQGQAFFANAEEGDVVLFFSQAKKAILYRPTSNKIIDVAALSIENGESTKE